MTRDPHEFETRRLENLERLQRQLVDSPDDRDAWLGLARARLQQGRPAEALVAFEHGLWNADPNGVAHALIESGWPWGDDPGADPAERLYGQVLGGATDAAAQLLTHEPTLRLRSSWLLWCQLGPPSAEVRERLLAALPAAGLATRDLPPFAKDSTEFATWSRAEVERTIQGLDVSS